MSGARDRAENLEAGCGARSAVLCAAAALLWMFVAGAPAAAGVTGVTGSLRTVVATGTNLTPGSDAVRFDTFATPSLNNRGEVAFIGTLTGDVTSLNDSGLWIATGGGFELAAREGDMAVGYPAGSMFGTFQNTNIGGVPINDAGRVAFIVGAVTVTPVTLHGLWTGDGDQLNLIAKQGDTAPGATGGATFNSFSITRPTLNRHGTVAFQAGLSAPYTVPANNGADGVWRVASGGVPEPVALIHENAVGLGTEATFVDFHTLSTHLPLNRAGTVALRAAYNLMGGTAFNGPGLWAESGVDPELRAWALTPAPELGPSATASVTTLGGIDSAGNVVFNGNFAGGTVGVGKGGIIGVASTDGLHVVAYQGGPAPGAGAGHVFSSLTFPYEPTINSAGQVAFYGNEYDGVDFNTRKSGVWAGTPGELTMVAREGDPAPGSGLNFGAFFRSTPALNRFGQVAFANSLVSAPTGTAATLWATDLDGQLMLIARGGDMIEVAPGDLRTIQSLAMLTFHGDDDGKARGLNDLGQVAVRANFVDGTSGVFLSNLMAHLPGDYNVDGIVDAADYTVWRDGVVAQDLAADGNRDGMVDGEDYGLWKEFYGLSLEVGGGEISTVPEISTAVASAIALLVALMGWSRWRVS